MANQGNQSDVAFRSESGNVDFQPETGGQQQPGIANRIGEAAQAVNWGKVGVGVGAAAAVAGAAYAASRYVGRGTGESDTAAYQAGTGTAADRDQGGNRQA
ncbi:MAG TPA: hypothetical protein VF552_09030 [Allosphingosinicella sp.]|jgi:hypothetical protein